MDAKAILVKLYCKYSTNEIETTDGEEQLLQIPDYRTAFVVVSECSSIVDILSLRYHEPDEQMRESLRLLRGMVDRRIPSDKIETTKQLVEGRLRRAWHLDLQRLYDDKKKILEWRDFFVSYTNRDAEVINREFRHLIRDCGLLAPGEPKRRQGNYLARAINRHLRRYQQLNGFWDDDDLPVGDKIKQDLEHFCSNAFALVQLIEPLSFESEPPDNWCFYEYTRFNENPTIKQVAGERSRHFFVLTDQDLDAIEPANLDPKYQNWKNRIKEVRHVSIALNNETNISLRRKIQAIARQIVELRSEIIESWLA